MRIRTILFFYLFVCCRAASQQSNPAQSTTTFQSSITGSATTVSPPKYYVGTLDLAKPASDPDLAKKCAASDREYTLKSDLKDEPYTLGEAPFVMNATTSDGCPVSVTLTVTEGQDVIKLSADSSGSTFAITLLKTGQATLHVEESPFTTAAAKKTDTKTAKKANSKIAPPVDWTLTVEENVSTCIPDLLPQKPAKTPKADASSIVQYLGNPYPYSFQVVGDKLLVYSAKQPAESEKKSVLATLDKEVQDLVGFAQAAGANGGGAGSPASTPTSASPASTASASPKPAYSIEVSIPHYAALGDLATRLNTLNYSDFTIQDVGSSKVRITSAALPACSELTAFLRDLRDVAWKPIPENPVAKLFFLNASDITGALGSSTSAPAASSSSTAATPSTSQTSGSATPASGAATGAAATASTAASGSSTSPTTAVAPTSTIPTPTPATPASSSSSASPPSASSSGSGAGGSPGAATPAAGGSPSSSATALPAPPTVAGVGTDTLLFQDAAPGDDAAVTERKRLVALLDLPRPQMLINVWTLQTSSSNGQVVADAIQGLHKQVDGYNGTIQSAIERGWAYLRDQITQPASYFDIPFYKYMTAQYVQDPSSSPSSVPADLKPQETAQRILNRQTGPKMPPPLRNDYQICSADTYCLGYTNLFQPLRPRLTDLLIATIASRAPLETMDAAVNMMEGVPHEPQFEDSRSCVETDEKAEDVDEASANRPRRFYMECFRAAAKVQFIGLGNQPSPLGLLRAALANFLFEYKLSQMYPHEFSDYELSQSAQTLNAQLAPLVDAFNRDLETFQGTFSQRVMKEDDPDTHNWFGAERPTLVNNGQISVRTISGFESTVSTTTQNFLDATQMPTLSGLMQSITGAAQTPSSTTSTGMNNVLQNISPIQAQVILGAISAIQSSKVQIGRSFSIDVTPRSLNGASAAELTIKINADEAAAPTYYSPTGSSSSADVSRVANHDMSTRVRVDSIKLFDVSTFTAVLQKSRTRFPLLPPLVEIPYIGTIIGIPLPPAKEFHSSMAVLSTIVVPTAADIVLGLAFRADRLVDSDGALDCTWPSGPGYQPPAVDVNAHLQSCRLKEATFLSDLRSSAIHHYHARMISCLANSGLAGSPIFDNEGLPATSSCTDLSLKAAADLE